MVNRMLLLKRISVLLITSLVILVCLPVGAVMGESTLQKLTLTLDESMQRGQASTHQFTKLDISVRNLSRQRDRSEQMASAARANLALYKQLKPQEAVYNAVLLNPASTPEELAAAQAGIGSLMAARGGLLALGMDISNIDQSIAFGDESLSEIEEYKHITKVFDFGSREIDNSISNININRSVLKNSLDVNIYNLYNNILNLKDNLELQTRLCGIQQNKYNVVKTKFESGKVSDLERLNSETDYKKAIISLDTLKRNLDNLYLVFKKMTGINLTQEVELKPDEDKTANIKLKSCDEYLSAALSNRNEILTAQNNLNLKQREFNITKTFMDSSTTEYYEASEAASEGNFTFIKAINSVTKDIKAGYADVIKKQNAIELTKKKLDNSSVMYEKLKKQYDLGIIQESMVTDALMTCDQARAGYVKAERDYENAVYRLEAATGIGPKYVMEAGVN